MSEDVIMASRRNQDRIGALIDAEKYVNSAHSDLIRVGHILRASISGGGAPKGIDEELALCRRKLDIAAARAKEASDEQANPERP